MCQFQHRAGEGGWRLLGKVVTRVGHLVVYAGPGEVTCRRAAVSGREVAICQAVQGDSRDRDGRLRSKLLLDLVVGRGTGCVSEAMTVGVKPDIDVVGIVEPCPVTHRGNVEFACGHRFLLVSRADWSIRRPVRSLDAARPPGPRGLPSPPPTGDRTIERRQSRVMLVSSVAGGRG